MKRPLKSHGEICLAFPKNVAGYACFILIILFSSKVQSQPVTQADYANDPVWIKMINDSNVNYYEAIKAYNIYWKNHVKPAGEEEEMSESGNDSKERERELRKETKADRKKVVTEEDLKKQNENNLMKYHIKRFEQWAREVKPFVQEDGRILTDHERMEIWNKQQQEIIQQKK